MKISIRSLTLIVTILLGSNAWATKTRQVEVTCDFTKAEETFGKMSLTIDLDKKDVNVRCVPINRNCVLDGSERTLRVASYLESWQPKNKTKGVFSDELNENTVEKMVIFGSNGDDTDLLFVLGFDQVIESVRHENRVKALGANATLQVMVDGNMEQSTPVVVCSVKLL